MHNHLSPQEVHELLIDGVAEVPVKASGCLVCRQRLEQRRESLRQTCRELMRESTFLTPDWRLQQQAIDARIKSLPTGVRKSSSWLLGLSTAMACMLLLAFEAAKPTRPSFPPYNISSDSLLLTQTEETVNEDVPIVFLPTGMLFSESENQGPVPESSEKERSAQ